MNYLGIDIGTSFINLTVLRAETGERLYSVEVPEREMSIDVPHRNWAEQHPENWWKFIKKGFGLLRRQGCNLQQIAGIGITYQMHGLVLVDEELKPLRPAIIWSDSRTNNLGAEQYATIGKAYCQERILGSPGNFTITKLKWVQENEPENYEKAKFIMLPGDFIASQLTGRAQISVSGLSEGMLWDFLEQDVAYGLIEKMGLDAEKIPEVVPNFGIQAQVNKKVAQELGLNPAARITYRAGDQPNNAFSLNVLNPNEIATTAGTSAVIYGVTDKNSFDPKSRVNTFLHVTNTSSEKRNGVLLNINGAGILYRWLRDVFSLEGTAVTYEQLNAWSAMADQGSGGLRFYPFGNGSERIFNNKNVFSGFDDLNFNLHGKPEIVRATAEGIVYALNYGFEVMREIGISGKTVRAGKSNLFQSPVFREIFANTTNTTLELYNTSGAEGAARGAAVGDGFFSVKEAFEKLELVERIIPDNDSVQAYKAFYEEWKKNLIIKE